MIHAFGRNNALKNRWRIRGTAQAASEGPFNVEKVVNGVECVGHLSLHSRGRTCPDAWRSDAYPMRSDSTQYAVTTSQTPWLVVHYFCEDDPLLSRSEDFSTVRTDLWIKAVLRFP